MTEQSIHDVDRSGDRPRAGDQAGQGSQSVRRALDLLTLIAAGDRRGGLSVAEVTDETALTTPTVHRLLRELLHAGYVEQAPDRRYRLGPEAYA
ncbi:helix-turn-helix domain-containing protein, partial [Prauserella cavernicola]